MTIQVGSLIGTSGMQRSPARRPRVAVVRPLGRSWARCALQTCFALAAACVTAVASAAGEPWPSRPVTIVVPYGAGGVADVLARTLAEKLQPQLGQPVIVDNKPGGNTLVATNFVMRSAPDGHTLYVVASQLNQMPLVSPKLFTYDALSDFTPISLLGVVPLVVVANANFPASNLKGLIEHARAHPGKVSVAATTLGATDHLAGELLAQRAGVKLNFIPYKGGAQGIQDVASGVVDLRISSMASAKPYVDSGRLKLIAVMGNRTDVVPGVPAVSETYPGLSVESLFGLVGPKGMPADVVARINRETNQIMNLPAVRSRLAALGMEAKANSQAEWRRMLEADTETWRTLIQKTGIKVE